MKAPNRIIPILALSVTACIPTAIAIFCAAAFDSRSESSLALLPLIGISFFAQIILQFYIGMLSPSFRSAFAISVPSYLSFGTALTVFCTRAQLLVIRRLASGYLYGIHWKDDTKTWYVFIALFFLLSVTITMLIIKGVSAYRREGTLSMPFRNLFAIPAVLVPIATVVYANVRLYFLHGSFETLGIAVWSYIIMFFVNIITGMLVKGDRLILFFPISATVFYLIFFYSYWTGAGGLNFPFLLILLIASSFLVGEALAVSGIRHKYEERKDEKLFEGEYYEKR